MSRKKASDERAPPTKRLRPTKGGAPADTLNEADVEHFVTEYLKLDQQRGMRKNPDPYDDLKELARVAHDMPGANPGQPNLEPMKQKPDKVTYEVFLAASAQYLYAVNPSLSLNDWYRLFHCILWTRHAGSFVRFRKRPKLEKLIDAGHMLPEELMKKHGIGRAHAHSLRALALKMKQAEARRKK